MIVWKTRKHKDFLVSQIWKEKYLREKGKKEEGHIFGGGEKEGKKSQLEGHMAEWESAPRRVGPKRKLT